MKLDLKTVINIAGKPGLYRVISTTKTNFLVADITDDKKRFSISGTSKVAAIADISIYTDEGQINLVEVFKKMTELPAPPPETDEKALKNYVAQAIPTYDRSRVYVSDMKKMVKWYNLLKDQLNFDADDSTEIAAEITNDSTETAEPTTK
jgi:hypothetical protein